MVLSVGTTSAVRILLLVLCQLMLTCLAGIGSLRNKQSPLGPSALPSGSAVPQGKKLLPDFYHTHAELEEELARIATASPLVTLGFAGANNVPDVLRKVTISPPHPKAVLRNTSSGTTHRNVVLIFGEHARELITSETALVLIKHLASNQNASAVARLLSAGATIHILPVVNPSGRALVEDGAFCRRTNEHGVDLNRNWGRVSCKDRRDVASCAHGIVEL